MRKIDWLTTIICWIFALCEMVVIFIGFDIIVKRLAEPNPAETCLPFILTMQVFFCYMYFSSFKELIKIKYAKNNNFKA